MSFSLLTFFHCSIASDLNTCKSNTRPDTDNTVFVIEKLYATKSCQGNEHSGIYKVVISSYKFMGLFFICQEFELLKWPKYTPLYSFYRQINNIGLPLYWWPTVTSDYDYQVSTQLVMFEHQDMKTGKKGCRSGQFFLVMNHLTNIHWCLIYISIQPTTRTQMTACRHHVWDIWITRQRKLIEKAHIEICIFARSVCFLKDEVWMNSLTALFREV